MTAGKAQERAAGEGQCCKFFPGALNFPWPSGLLFPPPPPIRKQPWLSNMLIIRACWAKEEEMVSAKRKVRSGHFFHWQDGRSRSPWLEVSDRQRKGPRTGEEPLRLRPSKWSLGESTAAALLPRLLTTLMPLPSCLYQRHVEPLRAWLAARQPVFPPEFSLLLEKLLSLSVSQFPHLQNREIY